MWFPGVFTTWTSDARSGRGRANSEMSLPMKQRGPLQTLKETESPAWVRRRPPRCRGAEKSPGAWLNGPVAAP